jgi:hypothetical protein
MAQEIGFFEQSNNSLPAHLQGVNLGVTTALMQGIFNGGNRIGVKGSRFRLVVNGNEERVVEENYIDVIVLSAAPAVSRRYYKGSYVQNGDNAPPMCYSSDGVVPNEDVKQKQSDKCMTCPQNVKGSKVQEGVSMKACAYFRRLVLTLAGDDTGMAFAFDANALTLFGDSGATAKSLNDYIKMLNTRGVDAGHVITRMSFDTDSSVPKVLFKPQGFVTVEQLHLVQDLVASDEVNMLSVVSMQTIDISEETSSVAPAQAQPAKPTAAVAQKPVAAQTAKPVAAAPATQRPRPAPTQPVIEDIPAEAEAPVEVDGDDDLSALLAGLDI